MYVPVHCRTMLHALHVEVDIRSYWTMMKFLRWSEVISEWRFRMTDVTLHQLAQSVKLLLRYVYGFIQNDPRGGFVTSWHRGGAVIRHVMFRVWQ